MIIRCLKTTICVLTLFFVFACTNEPVQIYKQVKVTVSPSAVLTDFVPYDSSQKEMSDDEELGLAKLRITALLYDEAGMLVDKRESLLNDYNSDYSFSLVVGPEQEYTLLCFSSSIHGSMEVPEYESYEFSGVENLSTLKVTQWDEVSYYSNWSVLGVGNMKISSSEDEYNISLRPETAFVYMLYRNIHSNDSSSGTSGNISGIYAATATDYFGNQYAWEIEVEQSGSSVVVKNLSPFFSSYDMNSATGYQIYEGYIEDGYIIIPQGQHVGYYNEDAVPAELYGVTEIRDNTIYTDDIYIKIGNGTLTFETGFATYLEGAGWFDAFLPGVIFISNSGAGIDRYYIIYHNNDILSYSESSGFYYKSSLDVISNNSYYISPADFPSANHIYTYCNLLPGEFTIFARSFIGNDHADYSEQEIKIEAGKQYYIELDCSDMNIKVVQGVMTRNESMPDAYPGYQRVSRNYVSSVALPLMIAKEFLF